MENKFLYYIMDNKILNLEILITSLIQMVYKH